MKILFFVAFLVTGCLSLSFHSLQRRQDTLRDEAVSRIMQVTRDVSPQVRSKRHADQWTAEFAKIDTNNDGVLTGDEFAAFYTDNYNLASRVPDFMYKVWKNMFDTVAPAVDVHKTPTTLELDELKSLLRIESRK